MRQLLAPAGPRWLAPFVWCTLLVIVTVTLHSVRDTDNNQAHVVLTYLLVVLGGSVSGGRPLGFMLAIVSAFLINYYFQPPFDTMFIGTPLDGIVLAAFFATAFTTTYLLARAREEAQEARLRAEEIERLSAEASHAAVLREAGRMKDVVLASVSHDLRTPLTAIKALAQDSADAGDENARIIVSQAERSSGMVNDLMDLSRLNAGAFPVAPELNTAEDLVGATLNHLAGSAGVERIHIDIDYTKPALIGSFDFVQSLRILTNVLDNALRYSPAGAPIVLSASRDDGWLIFSVTDSGGGIPAEDREHIFDAFYRHPVTSAGTKGTGLGLSIARQLAEAQEGRLEYSVPDDGGSVFTLRLKALDP